MIVCIVLAVFLEGCSKTHYGVNYTLLRDFRNSSEYQQLIGEFRAFAMEYGLITERTFEGKFVNLHNDGSSVRDGQFGSLGGASYDLDYGIGKLRNRLHAGTSVARETEILKALQGDIEELIESFSCCSIDIVKIVVAWSSSKGEKWSD
ncbi:MAG: hypothetical protein AAGB46_02625 [Verrucomicrobiota bacterium]